MVQGDGSPGWWRVRTNGTTGRQWWGNVTRTTAFLGKRIGRGQWTWTKDMSDSDFILVLDTGKKKRWFQCFASSARIGASSVSYKGSRCLSGNVIIQEQVCVWKACWKFQERRSFREKLATARFAFQNETVAPLVKNSIRIKGRSRMCEIKLSWDLRSLFLFVPARILYNSTVSFVKALLSTLRAKCFRKSALDRLEFLLINLYEMI